MLGVGGIVGLGVAYVALQRRDHPAARPLAWIAGLPGAVGLCYAALIVVPDLPGPGVILAVTEALMVVTVGYFLVFTLAYTGRSAWLTRRRRGLIVGYFAVISVATAVDIYTKGIVVRTVNGLTFPVVPARTEGLVFLVAVLSAYGAVFVGTGILVRFLISSRNVYRKQTALIVGAIGLSVVGGVVFEAGINIHPGLNLNLVFYSVEVVLIALALFRYEFLNVEPLAPDVVLEQIEDPVLVLDESDMVVDTNPAARLLVDAADPVGTPVTDLLPGLLSAVTKDETYVRSGSDAESGGQVEVYDLNAAPISDQYDRERGTVIVLRDISLQKERERTLEQLQSVSQRFLSAETADEVLEVAVTAADELLEYPYSGAMLYDRDSGVLRPATYAESLRTAFDDIPVDEMVVEPGETDVWTVFESGEPMLGDPLDVSDEVPVDIGGSLLFPLGEYGVLGISAGADHEGFTDDDRRFAEVLASTTENALDRVKKERQLRESRELVATRNNQIEFFNSVLRHDLLNGMQVVEGHVELLSERVDGEGAEHVSVIEDWTADMVSLTRNVRAVTGVISGDRTAESQPVDLGRALTEKARKVRDGHEGVVIDLVADVDALPPVRADEFLPEVFENLLTNAIEHNDRETAEITVDATVDGDVATVRVADNGPGVDDEQKEAVFDEAVTSEGSGSVGFGLHFVRVMVDRYGGDVWFEDRTDGSRGAVAVVELQVATDPGEGVGASQPATDD
jgi:signal transduction histidine kinase